MGKNKILHLQYLSGFGNEFSSEDPRCEGSLPVAQVGQRVTDTTVVNITYADVF